MCAFAGLNGPVAGNLAQVGGISRNIFDLLPNGRRGHHNVFCKLFFQVAVSDMAAVVQVVEVFVGVWRRYLPSSGRTGFVFSSGFSLVFLLVGPLSVTAFHFTFLRITPGESDTINRVAFAFRFAHFYLYRQDPVFSPGFSLKLKA